MSLLESLSNVIGDRGVAALAEKVGGDKDSVAKAVSAALPTMMGAMGRQADQDGGQDVLQKWLDEQDDDDSPDDAVGFFQSGRHEKTNSAALLDGLFGGKREKVEQGIGQASGLSTSQTGSLMKMLAPLVLAQLTKKNKKSSGGSVFDLIRSGRKEAEEQSSGGSSLIGRFLDQDGDGDFDFGDVMKIGFGFLGGKK